MTQLHAIVANVTFVVFIAIVVVGLRASEAVQRLYAGGFAVQLAGQALVVVQNLTRNQADGLFLIDPHQILMLNFLIDLVVFFYLLAYRYRKSFDEQQQLQLNLAQAQQQTNEAVIDVLESERQQVGSLLLQNVGGRIVQTRTLLGEMPPTPLLTEAQTLIDKTDDCLDQILRDGLPPDLMQRGLADALANLIEQRNQTETVQLAFRQEVDSPDRLPAELTPTQTRQLYRMANELINNLIKHAGASEGCVTLALTATGWQLTVSDNGRGFNPAQAGQAVGIGLKNIYARAQTLGATVQIDTGATGTRVLVKSSFTDKRDGLLSPGASTTRPGQAQPDSFG